MEKLSHSELVSFLVIIAVMLLSARIFGEVARKFKMPSVIGELIVGIILGPTVFGTWFPEIFSGFLPRTGHVTIALDGLTSLSVIMMLFVAGMEVQLPLVLQQGRKAVYTSVFSMVIPFIMGMGIAWLAPELFENQHHERQLLFSLFMGTAMAISALPVIARILMDLNLFKTNVGAIIISSAMFNDLVGWIVFSVILSRLENASHAGTLYTVGFVVVFGVFMLTVGKKIIDRTLPWMQRKLSWPGGVLSISLGICFLGAALTEFLGIHAILGAFIVGIAFGDSVHLKEKTREIIEQFIINVFAPLFFVSIGLKVDFVSNFDPVMVLVIMLIASAGKLIGAGLGAYLGGFGKRDSLVIGFGLNARGAMEIILGTLALNAGLIGEKIFVALVVMAMLTSITSGPLMRSFYRNVQPLGDR